MSPTSERKPALAVTNIHRNAMRTSAGTIDMSPCPRGARSLTMVRFILMLRASRPGGTSKRNSITRSMTVGDGLVRPCSTDSSTVRANLLDARSTADATPTEPMRSLAETAPSLQSRRYRTTDTAADIPRGIHLPLTSMSQMPRTTKGAAMAADDS